MTTIKKQNETIGAAAVCGGGCRYIYLVGNKKGIGWGGGRNKRWWGQQKVINKRKKIPTPPPQHIERTRVSWRWDIFIYRLPHFLLGRFITKATLISPPPPSLLTPVSLGDFLVRRAFFCVKNNYFYFYFPSLPQKKRKNEDIRRRRCLF